MVKKHDFKYPMQLWCKLFEIAISEITIYIMVNVVDADEITILMLLWRPPKSLDCVCNCSCGPQFRTMIKKKIYVFGGCLKRTSKFKSKYLFIFSGKSKYCF